MLEARARDLDNFGTQSLELLDGSVEGSDDAGLVAVGVKFLDHTDFDAAQVAGCTFTCRSDHRTHGGVDGRGVTRIVPGDDLVQ